MALKRRRSPAEKKALSYAKDRRNDYGENDKASRKLIPRRKAEGHRKVRRIARQQAVLAASETLDETKTDLIENALEQDLLGKQRWMKWRDQSLGEHIKNQKAKREWREGRKKWSQKMVAEAKEKGHSGWMISWRGSEDDSDFKPL